jgi:hypothetical protein
VQLTSSSPQSGSRSDDGTVVSPSDFGDASQLATKRETNDKMETDENQRRASPGVEGRLTPPPPLPIVGISSAAMPMAAPVLAPHAALATSLPLAAPMPVPLALVATPLPLAASTLAPHAVGATPVPDTALAPQRLLVVLVPRSDRVRRMFSRANKRSDMSITTITTKRLCSMIRNLCAHANWIAAYPAVATGIVRIYPGQGHDVPSALPTDGWCSADTQLQVRSPCIPHNVAAPLECVSLCVFEPVTPADLPALNRLGKSGELLGRQLKNCDSNLTGSCHPPW